MSDPIGTRHTHRHTCGDHHLPNCWNPQPASRGGSTACVCGAMWWPGHVGTWHSRAIRERVTVTDHHGTYEKPGDVVAWDRYHLHAPGCPDDAVVPDEGHVCGDVEPVTAAEMWGQRC